jgi:hypothetical protein
LNDNDDKNYNTNLANFEVIAVQSITTVAPTPLYTTTCNSVTVADIVVVDDDDIIIEKFVGGKLGETVTAGSTRMSVGFYRYAKEQIQIKQEKKEQNERKKGKKKKKKKMNKIILS